MYLLLQDPQGIGGHQVPMALPVQLVLQETQDSQVFLGPLVLLGLLERVGPALME